MQLRFKRICSFVSQHLASFPDYSCLQSPRGATGGMSNLGNKKELLKIKREISIKNSLEQDYS